ncbi:MAG: UDP-N-acetylmuramate dehydrogenase [Oscillospiraceae bacterium]|nr:UDP-N-acetylmuramate dehydrogenase [Oscillospiraceae bacterium]
MSDYAWRQPLCEKLNSEGISFRWDAPLAPLTTFKIGGPAALLCCPADETQAVRLLALLEQAGVRRYCLGKGSNTLFADEGFAGAVVDFSALNSLEVEGCTVTAGAGVHLATLCRTVQMEGLAGLEFAYGIPGAVGGAIYMNAGAYGGEMKDVVHSVRAVTPTGELVTFSGEECDFAYRHSVFERNGCAVLAATFTLCRDDPAAIAGRMTELAARRKEKQPLEWPSAGSTFKRPQGAFAAALIDQCGLKGMTVGGAQVSEKHAGFVINIGGASCADVIALTDRVAAIVKEKTGYTLEREIRVVK